MFIFYEGRKTLLPPLPSSPQQPSPPPPPPPTLLFQHTHSSFFHQTFIHLAHSPLGNHTDETGKLDLKIIKAMHEKLSGNDFLCVVWSHVYLYLILVLLIFACFMFFFCLICLYFMCFINSCFFIFFMFLSVSCVSICLCVPYAYVFHVSLLHVFLYVSCVFVFRVFLYASRVPMCFMYFCLLGFCVFQVFLYLIR